MTLSTVLRRPLPDLGHRNLRCHPRDRFFLLSKQRLQKRRSCLRPCPSHHRLSQQLLRRRRKPSRIGDYSEIFLGGTQPKLISPLPNILGKSLRVLGTETKPIGELPVGGRLKFFWREWESMGASRRVVRWFRFGLPLKFAREQVRLKGLPRLSLHAPSNLVTYNRDKEKQLALEVMISQLKDKNCIREMSLTESGFFSRAFLVKKKSGGWRLVIDLSELNKYLSPVTFDMDTLAKVKQTVRQGMWATSLDLSDAYHHIPMAESATIYLCFRIGDKRYMYLVLPFDLMSAPWAFTEVIKQLKRWTAPRLFVLFQYLDDWLSLQWSYRMTDRSTGQLLDLCSRLGLLVNFQKSELVPTQRIEFLGEILDFSLERAFPTPARRDEITTQISNVLLAQYLPFK